MSRQGWFMSSSKWFVLTVAMTYTGALAGCRPAEPPAASVDEHEHDEHGHDHDHDHDHAGHDHDGHNHDGDVDIDNLVPLKSTPPLESLSQGVDQLVVIRDAIAKGFADDDVDSIHDQLHDVGTLLGQIEEAIPAAEIPDAQKKEMQQAIETLFEAYGDVDLKLHGAEGKDYKDVSGEINSAIDVLTKNSHS
ncbi:hypothetical protein [Allorhodopirellula heiligendammensis]|uniref:Uncharacterized protein n=1 Tax=Allorhodopirellula heiligendammensis TaxID=2714739 RepID=A0A5C6BFK5_9BACT|nr:hypothetical protein [Allorhodopirellula heiligendammensis]TWU10975.1 hypothetical protein Poly21_48810 [Allorhodopirellula heiligendammensis]